MSIPRLRRTPAVAAIGAALLAVAGCTAIPPNTPSGSIAAATPIPPGQARLWLYRDYQPSVSFNYANIDLDGARIASVPAFGPGVFRDVVAGRYRLTPENPLATAAADGADVTVAPGQIVYLQIEDNPIVWGDMSVYQKDKFSIRPVPAEFARAQIAVSPQ